MKVYDFCIIGGGFFGVYLANFLASIGKKVVILEKEESLLSRASYNNQARVHGGYHYPRSTLTALRSRELFPSFVSEFKNCIVDDFSKYYLISNQMSKITARQFQNFCKRIGAPCVEASGKISHLYNRNLISGAYEVQEYAFDSIILQKILAERLFNSKAEIKLGAHVQRIKKDSLSDLFKVEYLNGELTQIQAKQVINCTYSNINSIETGFPAQVIDFKYEITEICLISIPDKLQKKGITVMCGPFFSVMPFPSTNLYSLTHVRYTPHFEWTSSEQKIEIKKEELIERFRKDNPTAFVKMLADSSRYIPSMSEARHIKSLWEIKTILPKNEKDDGRPILFQINHGTIGYHCVLGGKIDNVYDAINIIKERLL